MGRGTTLGATIPRGVVCPIALNNFKPVRPIDPIDCSTPTR